VNELLLAVMRNAVDALHGAGKTWLRCNISRLPHPGFERIIAALWDVMIQTLMAHFFPFDAYIHGVSLLEGSGVLRRQTLLKLV
jgi:hypothetical protein